MTDFDVILDDSLRAARQVFVGLPAVSTCRADNVSGDGLFTIYVS